MRQIVNKRVYDTGKAKLVACWANMDDTHNFDYQAEALYLTKAGAWFLHGEGNARSEYCTQYGTSVGWGERLVPLCENGAMKWLERHGKTEALEEHFRDHLTEA